MTSHYLQQVIATEAQATGMACDLVAKLIQRVDELKLMGYTGGEASSKFGDYLTFLGLPDSEHEAQFFARRWTDHRVVIPIPEKLRHFAISDTPVFTVSRLEPQYEERPFYKQGIPKVDPGTYGNRHARGSVREARKLKESYSNFIIMANMPPVFYMEADNERLDAILSSGLPTSDSRHPYKLYTSIGDARDSLFRDLATHGRQRSHLSMVPTNFTLLEIQSDGLQLDNGLFYTRTLNGHKQGSRTYGYYYEGAIDRQHLSVSPSNVSA